MPIDNCSLKGRTVSLLLSSIACWMRRTDFSAIPSSTPGSRIANSSPPMRAITSSSRKQLLRISDIRCSARSPAACPCLSLMLFRLSISADRMLIGCSRACFLSVISRLENKTCSHVSSKPGTTDSLVIVYILSPSNRRYSISRSSVVCPSCRDARISMAVSSWLLARIVCRNFCNSSLFFA